MRQTRKLGQLWALGVVVSVLLVTREAAARESETKSSESSRDDRGLQLYGGPGIYVSQSLVSFPRETSYDRPRDYVRSYPAPGMSLSLDLELQAKHFLVGAEFQMGSWVRTLPSPLFSLHGWVGYIIGNGEIAPYIGGGLGGLSIGQDEKSKLGLAGNVTAGVLFGRSRQYLRPELTLQVFLPTFDTSNSIFAGQAPAFWPMAVVGVRLLI